uniref:C2H2-type domain-containing protein n=1 Tax=Gopherus agassizii TaxID=38772 RepID=A0A452IWU3_9SAUR
MKRPLSLSHPAENRIHLVETVGSQSEQRTKREKKHQSFTLCEVCNIQLNSAAQAQIHYNGKSHQKRLKQLSKGKVPTGPGPSGHSSPLLASLSIPGRPLHPPLDIKHFLTFRLNGTSPLNLFPNFNTMDPVQKAVINHTFGVPSPLKKKQFISCNICHLRFNSANQAEAHYKGHKHARRLKAIEAVKNKQKTAAAPSRDFPASLDVSGDPHSTVQANGLLGLKEPDPECSSLMLTPTSEESSAELSGSVPALVSPPVSELSEGPSDVASVASLPALGAETPATESGSSIGSAPDRDKEGKKSKQHLYCPTCKVTVNSASQLEAHNTGAKHKSMLEGQTTPMRRGRGKVIPRAGHKSKRIGNKGSINIRNKAFHCQVCEIYVNSETQLKQVMPPALPLCGGGAFLLSGQGHGAVSAPKHVRFSCMPGGGENPAPQPPKASLGVAWQDDLCNPRSPENPCCRWHLAKCSSVVQWGQVTNPFAWAQLLLPSREENNTCGFHEVCRAS